MANLNIGIVGCGIGGLSAAALLARQGHTVRIFDKFDSPAPVGSGLVVQPVGLDALRVIGADVLALEKGAVIDRLEGYEAGCKVLDVTYGDDFGLAIHRASLFDALYKTAISAGVTVQSSAEVTATEMVQNGRTITLHGGETLGPFDLVIDASGLHSPLSPMKSVPLEFGALWGTVNWPEGTTIPANQLSQRYQRGLKMAGVLPIGTLPKGSKPQATIFWSLRWQDYDAWRTTPIETWKSESLTLWPEFAPFLAQINSHDDLTMAGYSHGTLRRTTSKHMVHIGDCAHCASPQLGQGANMAMLDAVALAEALGKYPLPRALRKYHRTRRAHVLLYQLLSKILTPMYQSNGSVMPWLRNFILGPLSQNKLISKMLTKIGSGNLIPPINRLP